MVISQFLEKWTQSLLSKMGRIVGVRNLMTQAQKAWCSVKYYLSSPKNKNIDTYLTLFDTQIKHILLYASEAWADSMKANIDAVTLLTRNKLEIFQISIFKQILGAMACLEKPLT